MHSNDYISVKQILSDVLVRVNDEGYKNGLTPGWYVRQIHIALEELSFETFYQEFTLDFDVPENFILELPTNCFNIRHVYLYNGDCFIPTSSVIVYPKKDFYNKPTGQGYTANRRDDVDGTEDEFYPQTAYYPVTSSSPTLYYYNIQNGSLMLSSNSAGFTKIRISYNGMGGEEGDEPVIPRMFRTVVQDFLTEKYYSAMKGRDRKFATSWNEAYQVLQVSWEKAMQRMALMDTAERDAYRDYLAHLG